MKCRRGYEIRPYKSAAGWYMGTRDELGYPQCRLSADYAKTEDDAWDLPLSREYAMENAFCHANRGCMG